MIVIIIIVVIITIVILLIVPFCICLIVIIVQCEDADGDDEGFHTGVPQKNFQSLLQLLWMSYAQECPGDGNFQYYGNKYYGEKSPVVLP